MIAQVLLDTDILSEYLKGHDPIVTGRRAIRPAIRHIYGFTSVTVYEIVYEFELKQASAQLKKAMAWLSQNEQITPTNADYLAADTIKATARRQGFTLELPDCLIAAVAVRLGRPLVTGNTDDFEAVKRTGAKLTIANWRDP